MSKLDSPSPAVSVSGPSVIIELNVGGVFYTTTLATLASEPNSLLARTFTSPSPQVGGTTTKTTSTTTKDSKGRHFIDRDGVLFRYILDYLRNKLLTLPDTFHEYRRLRHEAMFYELPGLIRCLEGGQGGGTGVSISSFPRVGGEDDTVGGAAMQSLGGGGQEVKEAGYVVIGYRGTFAFGRDGMADVKFRKLARILASGRVSICREVFQDTLNESRDPDRGTSDRYSARFFLKHSFIEQAFDALQEAGFRMVGSAGSGTNSAGETKPGMDSEENKWNHYNEFVFCRP